MKRTKLVCILCLLLLFITACSDDTLNSGISFANGDEMLKHLEGMWVLEDNSNNKTYYIFQGGQAYITSDTMYSEAAENALDQALETSGVSALPHQNFTNITKRLYLKDFSIACEQISMIPEEGLVKLFAGESNEERIVITENSVLLQTNNCPMTKISDTKDFSLERFETLFNNVTDTYTVSIKYFWMDPMEYGEMIKTTIPHFEYWTETPSDTGNGVVYKPSDWMPVNGGLLVSSEEVDFVYTIMVDTWNNNHPTLKIYNKPKNPGVGVFESYQSTKLTSLIQYCLYAVQNCPGAYTDPVALANDIAKYGTTSTSSYYTTTTMIANGFTYMLTKDFSGNFVQFHIGADETLCFPLSDVLALLSNTEPATPPTNENTTQPPAPKPPAKNDVPITADFADKMMLNNGNYYHCIADTSEYMVQIAFQANEILRDVSFTSLTFSGDSFQVAEELYYVAEMNPDKPLVADVSFPGSFSRYGISFTTSDGTAYNYAVATSGKDGSLFLYEYTP